MNSDLRLVRLEEERQPGPPGKIPPRRRSVSRSNTRRPFGASFDGGGIRALGSTVGSSNTPRHWTDLQRFGGTQLAKPFLAHTHVKVDRRPGRPRDTPDSADPDLDLAALRSYVERYWDVDDLLTYLATYTWMGVWDDVFHNYFLWQKRSGKWAMLPWDFDAMFSAGGPDGPGTASIFSGEVGWCFFFWGRAT